MTEQMFTRSEIKFKYAPLPLDQYLLKVKKISITNGQIDIDMTNTSGMFLFLYNFPYLTRTVVMSLFGNAFCKKKPFFFKG